MDRKKLLALGCAVGILGFGACFTPPPAPSRPPRHQPQPHVNLHGNDRIRVVVTAVAGAPQIDSETLAYCVADSINNLQVAGVPRAVVADARIRDAVLAVVVEKGTATPDAQQVSPGSATWEFAVTLSATLTRADGATEWQAHDQVYKGTVVAPAGGSPWTSESFPARAQYSICNPMAMNMLFGRK